VFRPIGALVLVDGRKIVDCYAEAMSLRHSRFLRGIARRLPVVRGYERRITELTRELSSRTETQYALWAPPGHFYSPIVDTSQVLDRLSVDPNRELAGVDLGISRQWQVYEQLSPILRDVSFAVDEAGARSVGSRYFSENPAFGDGDAAIFEAVMRHLRPSRIVELGCGHSSACLLDTRDRYLGPEVAITFVDPLPQLLESLIRDVDRESIRILPTKTQDLPLDLISGLNESDILFVDSTHVAKTGSDVLRIFHEILPTVKPGVWIHLHDHFAGFEYPRSWVSEGRSWNEQYLTRAFLQFNQHFEIALWPQLLHSIDSERFFQDVPRRVNVGGSLWLRRTS
jgi:hypothetical protein